ncbi:glycosyl transferase [Pedobacter sp. R20-19]|uniref:glycosyl transferase n=1 Tax=Pedobacter sp. R20-19 TaxID=1270196 RepID=UPI0012F7F47E|nr:glycosyl transferase [Pedobacter sp. R20-19]
MKTIQRFGGIVSYRKMLAGKKEMIKASLYLPHVISTSGGYKIYFLTGQNYLYQTLFCALSLTKISKNPFQFILIDDGSFDQELTDQANKQMPGVKIITKEEVDINLESKLPIKDFPYLHYKRKVYPHLKKLTDIHTIVDNPYKLVLDSDMLFWNDPIEIISWLKDPVGSLYMIDCEESYGFTRQLMESLCQVEIPELVNVGAIGMNSNAINWMALEHWAKTLEETEGASYFLEQALSAMIIAKQKRSILNPESYLVNPEHGKEQLKILGHYVDLSKREYFTEAWKHLDFHHT